MSEKEFTLALLSEVFFDGDAEGRLRARLREAKDRGADLVLLPELPLNPWSPATRTLREEDAEPPGGPRHQLLARLAQETGVGVVGGAIVREPASGRRTNTALVFDAAGRLVESYGKAHLPEEEGFWETSHYQPGLEPAGVVAGFAMPLGIQICSDANRPQGSHALAAQGAELILVPRASVRETWERWWLVLRANAMTSNAFVATVNRPAAEQGVNLGGPAAVFAPDAEVLLESTDRFSVVTLRRELLERARRDYPGYLPVRARLYRDAWDRAAQKGRAPGGSGPDED